MPIYVYRCSECYKEQEILAPYSTVGKARACVCGGVMGNIPTYPSLVIFPIANRQRLLNALNKDAGFDLPSRPENRAIMEKSVARGLDCERPTVGRGFGNGKICNK